MASSVAVSGGPPVAGPIEEHLLPLDAVSERHPDSGIRTELRAGHHVVTEARGLTEAEAARRLREHGPNVLTPPPHTPLWRLLVRQFGSMFMVMLWVSGLLSLTAYLLDRSIQLNLWLGLILFGVVLVSSTMNFMQERKTSKLMSIFASMAPPCASVTRDGVTMQVAAADLVVGDIVSFRDGEVIPADVRLLQTANVRVECSSLTGESTALAATTELSPAGTSAHESHCLAFSSSVCLQGRAMGLVVRTGDHTMIGTIAVLASRGSSDGAGSGAAPPTTLEREIRHFVRFVALLAFGMASLFFAIGVGRQHGDNALNLFINGFLIVIVANVPQGLPATVTSLLAITARRMAAQNVFVKRLDAIETLGSASVIASDKTGTITQNVMTVRELWCNGMAMSRGFEDHLPDKANRFSPARKEDDLAVYWLLVVASVCNRATRATQPMPPAGSTASMVATAAAAAAAVGMTGVAASTSTGSKLGVPPAASAASMCAPAAVEYTGNPSEVAMARFVEQYTRVDHLRAQYDCLAEIPFNSTNKWHLVICAPRHPDKTFLARVHRPLAAGATDVDGLAVGRTAVAMIKGAPEVLVARCSHVFENGAVVPATAEFAQRVARAVAHFGGQLGRRMIGFAARVVPLSAEMLAAQAAGREWEEKDMPSSDFVFLGLAALADPPRENAATAVAQCRSAGIKVLMVTGDHALTAQAIAREVGILDAQELAGPAATRRLPGEVSPGVYQSPFVAQFTQADWAHVLSLGGAVFARATPEQKLLIVKNCQELGHVVAVTGDGVNDAPALRQANIGVAMGRTGSAVAREAAQVLLMDDNFASIVAGVLQGRLIIDNLRKTIRYVLAHLLPEIVPVLLNLSLGLPLGLTSMQVLSIDLGTEVAAAVSLAYEPPERGILARPPRARGERLVTRHLLLYSYLVAGGIETLGCFLAYVQVYWHYGLTLSDIFLRGDNNFLVGAGDLTLPDGRFLSGQQQEQIAGEAASAWYVTLVMSQAAHIWLVKAGGASVLRTSLLGNPITFYGVGLEIAILLLLSYVPGVMEFMGAARPRALSWLFWIAVALVLLAVVESLGWRARRAQAAVDAGAAPTGTETDAASAKQIDLDTQACEPDTGGRIVLSSVL